MDFFLLYKETSAEEGSFDDISTLCEESKLTYSIKKTQGTEPQAALEWLIPTAVVVYFGKEFVKSFASKLGNEAAEFVIILAKKLKAKCFGNDKVVSEELITVGGKIIESKFSRNLSIAFPLSSGKEMRLLFEHEITTEELETAFFQFFLMFDMYQENPEECPVTPWIENNIITRNWDQLAFFNRKTQMIEFLDYIESSKNKKIISCPVDHAWDYHESNT